MVFRGRIDISNTIKRNGFSNSKLSCSFDELDNSTIHNRIIKSTLAQIVKTDGLDKALREDVHAVLQRLDSVAPIQLATSTFAGIRFHSNIRNYRLPISVCQLIYEQLIPSVKTGKYSFVDLPDENYFGFSKILFNFYKQNLKETVYHGIKKEGLFWQDVILKMG